MDKEEKEKIPEIPRNQQRYPNIDSEFWDRNAMFQLLPLLTLPTNHIKYIGRATEEVV